MTLTTDTVAVESTTAPAPSPAKPAKAVKAKAPKAAKAPATFATSQVEFEDGVVVIPLSKLTVPADGNVTRPEAEGGTGDVAELAASLRTVGQQTPVVVRRTGDGYTLVAGFRRTAALKSIGAPSVLARVVRGDDLAALVAHVAENESARREIGPLGRVAGYAALAARGLSTSEIASLTGRAVDFVADHLKLPKADPAIIAALSANGEEAAVMTWGVARLIIRKPKAAQAGLAKRLAGCSVNEARKVLAKWEAEQAGEEVEEDAEGEGEGGEGEAKAPKADAGLSPAKVAKVAVPFARRSYDALDALLAALRAPEPNVKLAAKLALDLKNRAGSQLGSLRSLLGQDLVAASEKAD